MCYIPWIPPPPSIDQYWMSNLPANLPSIEDQVNSGQPLSLANGDIFTDSTHNFTLPWLIIATVDAYPQGNTLQRARALRLFDQIAGRRGEVFGGIQNK